MASESLPDTHRTLVLTSRDKPLTIEKRPVPTLTSGSAIVRVLASQVISYAGEVYSGKRPYPFPTPFVPGTSCVARVVAVGPDATSLKPGKLVYIHIFIAGRDDPDKLCLVSKVLVYPLLPDILTPFSGVSSQATAQRQPI